MLVVTFHTQSYVDDVLALEDSAAAHGVSVRLRPLKDYGSWFANLRERPAAMLRVRRLERGPLLFVDADCRIAGPLAPIEDLLREHDIAVRVRPTGDRYNLGVLGLADNDRVVSLLDRWVDYTLAIGDRYGTADQRPFELAMAAVESGFRFKIASLPEHYNAMPADGKIEPLIAHSKKSRQDPVHREWVKCRQLEAALVGRLKAELAVPLSGSVKILSEPSADLLEEPAIAINWIPSDARVPIWANRTAVMLDALQYGRQICVPHRLPGGVPLGSLLRANWVCPDGERPNAERMPTGLCAYYRRPDHHDFRLDDDLPADPALAAAEYIMRRGAVPVHKD